MGWVALLRGINVGGGNRLPMGDLRSTCESIGFRNVRTYIQSGNVVFDDDRDERGLARALRRAVADRHGLDVPVVVRAAVEWERIATAHPAADTDLDPKLLHVWFLDRAPAPELVGTLDPTPFLPDTWHLEGREAYLSYPRGSARSKLTIDVFERTLDVVATGRNLNTVRKLAALIEGA